MMIKGWKTIARYLQCTSRTAQTYHYQYKMPVLPGAIAYTEEIDIWMDEWSKNRYKSRICNLWKLQRKKFSFSSTFRR